MRRLTNPRSIAKAILENVKAGTHYDQGSWFSYEVFENNQTATGTTLRHVFEKNTCGSTACVAGTAVVLTLPKNAKYDWLYNEVILPSGSKRYVQSYAGEVMGLNNSEADWLFDGNREVEEVIEALELLVKGKSISPLVTASYDD